MSEYMNQWQDVFIYIYTYTRILAMYIYIYIHLSAYWGSTNYNDGKGIPRYVVVGYITYMPIYTLL